MRAALPLAVLSLAALTAAQDRPDPRFRIGLGFAGGTFDFDTDGSNLEDDESAAMLRVTFEATTARGIGGGARIESVVTDDDLFADAGFAAAEARNGTLFGHFTYRLESHRFAMPMRAGLLFNGLTLEEEVTGDEVEYASIGPAIEIAPELTLVRSGTTRWSVFGEMMLGATVTRVEIDGAADDYDSDTGFFGLELGTRVLLGPVELGLSYVGRWQSMDESDEENGTVAFGYDAEFQGVMFNVGVVF